MSEFYAITDLVGYATQMRDAASKSICGSSQDNLDEYITIPQMITLVKEQCNGFDDEDRPLLDEDTNENIFEDTVLWIHEVGLAKLAAQNLIECAWDDKTNTMIFWKDDNDVRTKNSTGKNKKTKGSDSGL